MDKVADPARQMAHDTAPGEVAHAEESVANGIKGYAVGLAFASVLTIASFVTLGTDLIWAPGIPVLLFVLAIAQMGIHLVFFLHVTSGPDNTNNILALAFGMLIVIIVVAGSLWIMYNLNENMAMDPAMMSEDMKPMDSDGKPVGEPVDPTELRDSGSW